MAATGSAPAPGLERLRAVRRGQVGLADVVADIDAAEAELERLRSSTDVPPEPDRAWVDDWLHRSHVASWARACLSMSGPSRAAPGASPRKAEEGGGPGLAAD